MSISRMISRSAKTRYCTFMGLLLLLLLLPGTNYGQVTTGTLLGTVQDSSGAAIRGATVTARNLQTGLTRSVPTGDDGGYEINLLPVGDYSIRVEFIGFKADERSPVTLLINSRARVDFALQSGLER